jgi:hypothetical protein
MDSSKEQSTADTSGLGAGPPRVRRPRAWARAGLSAALLIAALALSAAAPALSAAATSRPAVSTGAARQVSYSSAVLTGSVNPEGRETNYYFQYGLTTNLGGQTAIADGGAGTKNVSVGLPIEGLQPLTVYHYRLVAVNSAGATIGSERTLLTTKVPLSLQILAAPDPVVYGGTMMLQGTLSGTDNGNREVVLQEMLFPWTAGFTNVGNPELTSATGGFAFPVLGLTEATQFRVVTITNPPVVSPVALEDVAVQVEAHVGRSRRAHHVRVFGIVTPAENGMQVGVMRFVHGGTRLAAGCGLRPRSASSSQFSCAVPHRRGVYEVLVRVTTGAQVSSYGGPLVVH